MEKFKVPVRDLRRQYDPSRIGFNRTDEGEFTREMIGQERAIDSLKFGLRVKKKGYNIFVAGITGAGKNNYSYALANEFIKDLPKPDDWCYVFNFKKPARPKAIKLKTGDGAKYKEEMENLISRLKIDIPKVFSSKEYEISRNNIYNQFDKMNEKIIDDLNEIAQKYNFEFKQTDKGLVSYPLINGRPIREDELDAVSDEKIAEFRENSAKLNEEAYEVIKELRNLEIALRNKLKKLNEKMASDVVEFHLNTVKEQFLDNEAIQNYSAEVKEDIVKHISAFLQREEANSMNDAINKNRIDQRYFKRYEVNLFIDNSSSEHAPVIRENNPTYYNLLGKIEFVNERGVIHTDHTRIKPGSIHEANGGYLILQAKEALRSPYAWEGLKRALVTEQIEIENITKESVVVETIKPEPIPIDLKIILVGDNRTYQILYYYDHNFQKLFKVKADFDVDMDRNEENVNKLARFIAYHCQADELNPFEKSAIGRIIEHSSRRAADKTKLTARFNEIIEIIYEADAISRMEDEATVTSKHVVEALQKRVYRNNRYEENLLKLFEDGTILIDTHGKEVGQINGLAVLDSGQYSFGKPSRITVSTFAGQEGIINIEREVEQSGSSHDKGVLIMSGYIGDKYARHIPLSLIASITFEQSYGMIDGDSASSTELYALLSSLSEVPIKQSIAVTGSVNQKGFIQPIGGVNEKIEGFYKVCKMRGLKGGEGVMIPHQNVKNLMLCDEVIQAVKEGKFNIYSVKTIEEGIEILTGVEPGEKDENGNYPEGTINYKVQKKLEEYAEISKEYS